MDYVTPTGSKALNAQAVTSQQISPSFSYFLAAIVPQTDPIYFHQAIKHNHWIDAINAELTALEANKTWEVTELPPNRKEIGYK